MKSSGRWTDRTLVSVLQQRRGTVRARPLRYTAIRGIRVAVAPGREQEFGSIIRWVEAADDRIAFQQNLLSCTHVVIVDGGRRGERGIRVAHDFRVELGIDR